MSVPVRTERFAPEHVRLAAAARALAHPARLQILQVLARRGTCLCGDLVEELPLAQASVSRHLKTLKEAGLIRGEVDGPRSCYCLDYEAIQALRQEMGRFLAGIPDAPDQPTCC